MNEQSLMGRAWITQLRGAILRSGAALVIALAAASGQGVMAQEGSTGVQVTLPESASEEPLTGRLFLFVTQRGGQPMNGPNWFQPEPFYGRDVTDWQPGTEQTIDDAADHFPDPISKLPAGKYRVQALFDHDFYYPSPSSGVGNFYSEVAEIEIADGEPWQLQLDLTETISERPIDESDRVKVVKYKSELLSQFHDREVVDRCAVILPEGYDENSERRYPTLYIVSGFGGSLRGMIRSFGRANESPDEVQFIRILLTGECKWGHHVYADSATNGPRGQALIEELIPLIDERFRTVNDTKARYVGGHSSGGWSSLWLQVRYPEMFGGVWSTSPDPVDFRDYQQTDLYAEPLQSIYFFADGEKKPLARSGPTPVVWYPDFAKMDDCLKRGGQLRSFEAVFSPRGADGEPAKMWDRSTGKVDPDVVAAWKPYDIGLRLRENWQELKPKLAGKIHVTMGDLDTFYLDGATVLLKQTLKELGSDAKVEIIEGADHGNYLGNPEFREKQAEQMSQQFLKYFNLNGSAI